VGFPQNHLRTENYGKSIVSVRQCERRHRLVKEPRPDALVGWREAMHQKTVNIGPVRSRMSGMPYDSLTANVTCGCNTNRF